MAKYKENKELVLADGDRYKFYWWPSEEDLELVDTKTWEKRVEIFKYKPGKYTQIDVYNRAKAWLAELENNTFNWKV